MLKILIKFGKRTKYYARGTNSCPTIKYPTIYKVKDINSVDELMEEFNDTIYLVNGEGERISNCICKSLYYDKTRLSDEELSIMMDYFNADQNNILTFLSDLKEKNFIDAYVLIYNIKF